MKRFPGILLFVIWFCWPLFGSLQTVDRIIAIVDEEIITLTDLLIYENFFALTEEISEENSLDHLVDQKLVIQRSRGEISLSETESEVMLDQIEKRRGREDFLKSLDRFGMERKDLFPYIREASLFDKIIFQRFESDIFVSLSEVESYYHSVYIPDRKRLGLVILPFLDVFEEIETSVKREKIKLQTDEWIADLRKTADIKIFDFE